MDQNGHSRRDFIRLSSLSLIGMTMDPVNLPHLWAGGLSGDGVAPNMIGAYGPWAASIAGTEPGPFSFRHQRWTDLELWRQSARERFLERLAQPEIGGTPPVTVLRRYAYDGLEMEEISWQLPYGPATEAVLLKPQGALGRLPGVLALHDHGGNKAFGWRKLVRTSDERHPMMVRHQDEYYGGMAWANELARRGYVVLVPDAFAFGSRRVRVADVPERLRRGVRTDEIEQQEDIDAYNRWASDHEAIMAKSLHSAGTTWPGVFLAEDQRALDVLCARSDVDQGRIGIGGLSGGGLRTAYLGGADPRVRCAVCVGMMSTWRDFLLNTSHTHTWMIYVPLLPREMDYPEIYGLRAPLPTMVLNNNEDQLFTLPEMQRADGILREVFRKAGATDRYTSGFYPGPHKFDREMQRDAFAWFDRWLG